ncbi:MAG: hypothetical protein JWM63_5283 [Gammaproteobacteria bacterium]|nr:hypothetical protein [Gammaproteobacteria bacterium]
MADHIGIREIRRQLGCAIAIGVTSLLIGCATSPAAKSAKAERHLQRAATALANQTDADSLAAAGLLSLLIHRDEALVLITRAIAVAPERRDLVWLQTQVCHEVTSCDPEPIERHLRELDPSNGAGWIGALVRANSSRNDEAKDAALAAIGHSDRVDIYWTTLSARLSRATAQTKTISLEEAEVSIIGVLAAQAIPAYGVAANACKGEQLRRAEIVEVCRGVARAFERGDTYITEMVGLAIAKRVWPEDSPEWIAAAEARHLYEYRSKFWTAVDLWNTSHAEEYLTLCAQNRREQDVFLAQLIAAGKNPNPPRE